MPAVEPVTETPRDRATMDSPISPKDAVRAERAAAVRRLDRLADLLDSRFRLFGVRFGIDGLISLIPVAGDLAMTVVSLYLVAEAARLGARKRVIAQMIFNVAVDTVLGAVPLIGDVFDILYKANNANIRLLKKELSRDD